MFQRRCDQVGQFAGKFSENRVDIRLPGAGVILVQQRVIGGKAKGFGLGRRDLARQGQDGFQFRQQPREITVLARGAPGHFTARRRAGRRFHQIGGHGGGMGVLAAHFMQVGARHRIFWRLGARQHFGHVRRGHEFVRQDGEGGDAFGPAVAGARGHHGVLVPAQNAQRVADLPHAGKTAAQCFIGLQASASGLEIHEGS